MATHDTIQDLEDIIPTRIDHKLDSSSTSHGLFGRDRPSKINARFRRRRVCFRQQQDELGDPRVTHCEWCHEDHQPRAQKKKFVWPKNYKKEQSPDVDWKTP